MSSSAFAFPSLDSAIANFENTKPSYNNPGGIMPGTFATSEGASGVAPNGIATFPDYTSGQTALDDLVQQYASQGATPASLINAWAPPTAPGNSPESTSNYINSVASQTGLDPNTPIPGQALAYDVPPQSAPSGGAGSFISGLGTVVGGILNIGAGTVVGNVTAGGVITAGNAVTGLESSVSSIGGILGQITGIANTFTSLFKNWSFGRVGTITAGVLVLGGGLLLLRPVRDTVTSGIKSLGE